MAGKAADAAPVEDVTTLLLEAVQALQEEVAALKAKPEPPVFAQQPNTLPRPVSPDAIFAQLKNAGDTASKTHHYDPGEDAGLRQRFSTNQIVEILDDVDAAHFRDNLGVLKEGEKFLGIVTGFIRRSRQTGVAKYSVALPRGYGGRRNYFETEMTEYAP